MTALEVRLIVYAVMLLALIGGSVWIGYHFTAQHYEVRIAQEAKAAAELSARAAEAAKTRQDAADAANRKIQDDLQHTLADVANSRDDLARRLRDNTTQTPGRNVPKGAGGPLVTTTCPTTSPDRADKLAAALTECFANEDRQDALIKELLPQL